MVLGFASKRVVSARITVLRSDLAYSAALAARSVLVGLALMGLTAPAMGAEKVALAIDPSKPGARIDRNIFGQFAVSIYSFAVQ